MHVRKQIVPFFELLPSVALLIALIIAFANSDSAPVASYSVPEQRGPQQFEVLDGYVSLSGIEGLICFCNDLM